MKQALLLKQFNYTIPASALALALVNKNHVVAEILPLMNVNIDFENGVLNLEGDWQFMIACNKHNEKNWLKYHRERVAIQVAIYADVEINLNNSYMDGLVLALEGSIKDGNCLSSCSGMLVIDNERGNNGLLSKEWFISFYLYDLQFEDCEIKFKLPLYQTTINETSN
ncbi:MAG: hypothetical protein ACKVOW_17680 [Chitinophagaceae bacterium]